MLVQLTLTLKMTTTQVVQTSDTVINNSPIHNYSHLDDRSLRADEIKLWLTPSAKQRRNPCSGLPAVYPDLSTRHDWPVKKGFVLFVVIANQVEGEFETHFR